MAALRKWKKTHGRRLFQRRAGKWKTEEASRQFLPLEFEFLFPIAILLGKNVPLKVWTENHHFAPRLLHASSVTPSLRARAGCHYHPQHPGDVGMPSIGVLPGIHPEVCDPTAPILILY